MRKKFVNKSVSKEFASVIGDFNPICPICHRKRSDVKYRRLYDYINCEYENVLCCGECERSIIEDGLL